MGHMKTEVSRLEKSLFLGGGGGQLTALLRPSTDFSRPTNMWRATPELKVHQLLTRLQAKLASPLPSLCPSTLVHRQNITAAGGASIFCAAYFTWSLETQCVPFVKQTAMHADAQSFCAILNYLGEQELRAVLLMCGSHYAYHHLWGTTPKLQKNPPYSPAPQGNSSDHRGWSSRRNYILQDKSDKGTLCSPSDPMKCGAHNTQTPSPSATVSLWTRVLGSTGGDNLA